MEPLVLAVLLLLLVLLLWWCSPLSLFARQGRPPVPYYFDNNGTVPPLPAALAAWSAAAGLGNASAAYASRAKTLMEDARAQVQAWLGAPWVVLFTSGGSESNNLALRGLPLPLFLGATEHTTSLECAQQLAAGRSVTYLRAEPDGRIAPATLDRALSGFYMPSNNEETNARFRAAHPSVLVSIMHANNETGGLNDLPALLQICRRHGALLHTDAVQTFGKYAGLAASCDLLSASFHKLGGPLGVGLLALRPPLSSLLTPQICGTQQFGLRGGTDNVPGIAGSAAALRLSTEDRGEKNAHQGALRAQLLAGLQRLFPLLPFSTYAGRSDEEARQVALRVPAPFHAVVLSPLDSCLPGTLLFSIVKNRDPHFCNIRLRDRLLDFGVAVSIGSACSTDKKGPGHVMLAIGAPFLVRCGVLRVSFGDANTPEEVCFFLGLLERLVAEQA